LTRKHIRATVSGLFVLAFASGSPLRAQTAEESNLSKAEAFVDAFYSFDADQLRPLLVDAPDSAPSIVFYQGWAEGGNYAVLDRMPCVSQNQRAIACSITVKDDLIGALGIDFNVTDTFHLTFADGKIVSIETSSDDPQAYLDAERWVQDNRPEVMEGACQGYFDGGPTPQRCVQAMVKGYAEFATIEAIRNDQ